jgi:hypothetical protein
MPEGPLAGGWGWCHPVSPWSKVVIYCTVELLVHRVRWELLENRDLHLLCPQQRPPVTRLPLLLASDNAKAQGGQQLLPYTL